MTAVKKDAPQKGKRRFFLLEHDTADLTKRQKCLYRVWNILCLLVLPFLVCIVSLKLAYGPYESAIFADYFTKPAILLLNYLPILLLELLLYAATGRQWIAFLCSALLIVVASIINFYKLSLRNDPVVFSDLAVVFTAFGFAGHYDMQVTPRVIAAVCSVPLGTVFLFFFARGRLSWKPRVVVAAAVLLSLYPLWRGVYSQRSIYNSPASENTAHIYEWSDTQQMVSRGFLYPFIYSATRIFESVPDGYSEQNVVQALAPYTDEAIPDNKKVSILAIQLEAFCDLTKLGIEGIDESAYAVYHEISSQCYAGDLVTNIFAGGTIDTERCFITGSSLLHYYGGKTPSYAWYLREQGYRTTGSHPCTWEFYNRRSVNEYLGFETYDFMENCYQQYTDGATLGDDVLFPAVLAKFSASLKNGPVFDFVVTYQGHGPYPLDTLTREGEYFDGAGCSKEAYYAVNNYLSGVKNTSDNLRMLLDALAENDAPVVVVIYGDHKPWLGNDAAYYKELGVNFDPSTEEGVLDYYGTDYLIWGNDAAKKVTGFDFRGQAPTTSSGYLMNIVFNTLGWKGPAYMQYTEQLRQTASVVTSTGLFCENGEFYYAKASEVSSDINLLLQVQYYRHRGFGKLS